MSKILLICASVGENLKLSKKLLEILHSKSVDAEIINLVDVDLPLFSSKREKQGVPEGAVELSRKMSSATGFIWVAPEYNGSVPPVLNNAIAWVSRSGADDWREAFNGKPSLIATHSGGRTSGGGGSNMIHVLRTQLSYLGSNVMGRTIITTYLINLNEESAQVCIEMLLQYS